MIIAALVIPVAVGFTALAVEGGLWYADHHQLRNIADAASLGAGWAFHDGADETAAANAAAATVVGYNAATDTVTVTAPPATGPYAGDPRAIDVSVQRTRPVLMSQLFYNHANIAIAARSTVRVAQPPGLPFCLLALNTSGVNYSSGGTGGATLTGCGAHFNSQSTGAITENGNATLTAQWVHSGGTLVATGSAGISSPDFRTGVAAAADPMARLTFPGSGSCTQTNYSTNSSTTLSPGRYCGGLGTGGHANVTLNPGTYIIDGGSLSLGGNSQIHGTGVTIILTGSGANWASVSQAGTTVLDLTAPTTGAYAGVVMAANRAEPAGTLSLVGTSGSAFNGAIYAPTQTVSFSGTSGWSSACTQIIAAQFAFNGTPGLSVNCPTAYALPTDGQAPASPVLVG